MGRNGSKSTTVAVKIQNDNQANNINGQNVISGTWQFIYYFKQQTVKAVIRISKFPSICNVDPFLLPPGEMRQVFH